MWNFNHGPMEWNFYNAESLKEVKSLQSKTLRFLHNDKPLLMKLYFEKANKPY